MTILVARSAAVLVLLLVLAGCAQGGGAGDGGPAAEPYPYAPDDLVLQVSWTGGFVTPHMLAGRLPLVSVYGDGRVITEGPVATIYPGPALPNLQVTRIDRAAVQDLVDRALDAGVGESGDLGRPPVADVPSTRFSVSTGLETIVREVHALETDVDEGSGLTTEQISARAELREFFYSVSELALGASQPYEPTAVAALVTEYVHAEEPDVTPPDTPWPGRPLPGEPFDVMLGISCVLATGDHTAPVLQAARAADALTPWVGEDGRRWSLTFRPLLPHESGCTDLQQD